MSISIPLLNILLRRLKWWIWSFRSAVVRKRGHLDPCSSYQNDDDISSVSIGRSNYCTDGDYSPRSVTSLCAFFIISFAIKYNSMILVFKLSYISYKKNLYISRTEDYFILRLRTSVFLNLNSFMILKVHQYTQIRFNLEIFGGLLSKTTQEWIHKLYN